MRRFFVGLLLGLCLTGFASALIGVGHGTVAPLAFSAGLLGMFFDLGPIIPTVGTPLLWGLYFLVVPNIDSRTYRLVTLIGLLALHFIVGIWFAYDDQSGMRRAYDLQPAILISFFLVLALSITILIFVSLRPANEAR